MDRRDAIRRISFLMGGVIIGSQLFIEGCTRTASDSVARLFEEDQIDFLGNIAETILPKTDTPGAKEAGVGSFIPLMVRDCYDDEQQTVFLKGLEELNKSAKDKFNKNFQSLDPDQRTELLRNIDTERAEYEKTKERGGTPHYFTMLKQLTLIGLFSSELGATQVLRYVAIPGKYDGDLPYKKGDRAWAT